MKIKNENKQNTTNIGLRMPDDLILKVKASAEKESRTFSQQIIHIVKLYYQMQENKD